jgi:hypothetical protein
MGVSPNKLGEEGWPAIKAAGWVPGFKDSSEYKYKYRISIKECRIMKFFPLRYSRFLIRYLPDDFLYRAGFC